MLLPEELLGSYIIPSVLLSYDFATIFRLLRVSRFVQQETLKTFEQFITQFYMYEKYRQYLVDARKRSYVTQLGTTLWDFGRFLGDNDYKGVLVQKVGGTSAWTSLDGTLAPSGTTMWGYVTPNYDLSHLTSLDPIVIKWLQNKECD